MPSQQASATLPPPENKVYFPALDGLRALALAMVFLDHYDQVYTLGLGVNVFFVLSGFLITGILLDTTTHPHRVRTFYIRRILRIVPLFYGVFLALLLLSPLLRIHWNSAWLLWPLHLGNLLPYLPGWLPAPAWSAAASGELAFGRGSSLLLGHFWSLCLEEQFYLLWPFVVFHLARRHLLRLCLATVLLLPLVRVLAAPRLPPAFLHDNILLRLLPFQLDSLLLGGLAALLWRGPARSLLLRWSTRLAPFVLAASAWLVLVHFRTGLALFPQPFAVSVPFFTWQVSVVNLFSAIVILAALQPASFVARALSPAPLRWVGRISYGAYIFHDIPHLLYSRLADHLPHPLLALNLLAAAGTLLLASLSFYLYERPFLRLKGRWS